MRNLIQLATYRRLALPAFLAVINGTPHIPVILWYGRVDSSVLSDSPCFAPLWWRCLRRLRSSSGSPGRFLFYCSCSAGSRYCRKSPVVCKVLFRVSRNKTLFLLQTAFHTLGPSLMHWIMSARRNFLTISVGPRIARCLFCSYWGLNFLSKLAILLNR